MPRRSFAILGAVAVVAGGALALDVARTAPAMAEGWPAASVDLPETVTADALPTVQINGVVWAQEVVGNVVYVGGKFTSARPAGSPLGTNELPRSNFLAYDLTTGELLTSVVINANAQIRTIKATPDGTRVYVGGDFTNFGGQARNRLAAIDTATNTLVPTFKPNVGFHVYDVAPTNDTVYIGGNFLNVGTQVRERLAAFSRNGALLSWAPSAPDRQVWAVRVSPDGTKVAIGGQFETFNGSTTFGRGLAMVDAVTGATLPFPAASVIRNGGLKGAITSLTGDADLLYGSGYTYGGVPSGTLEGSFAADWNGNLVWVNDCHGDTYSLYAAGEVVYAAGHTHYCGNIAGYGETSPQTFQRGTAYSKAVAGTVGTERLGYYNFAGLPRPDLLNFFPSIHPGTFTGQGQGPWSVDGDSRYVVYGGEFPLVNDVPQQGLVRFQVRQFASNSSGPRMYDATYPIKVQSLGAGSVTIDWQANEDRDDATLQYKVFRRFAGDTGEGQIVHTRPFTAPFWNKPTMTFTDTTAVPGAAYEYKVQVTDGYLNFANSYWMPVTVATTGAPSAYVAAVLASQPDSYWRFGESSGANASDLTGLRPAGQAAASTVTWNQPGAILGDADTAAQFSGGTGKFFRSTLLEQPPQVFSLEAWFKTAPTANGGLIVGFNQSNTANSGAGSTTNFDRLIYMDPNGRVSFGVDPSTPVTISTDRNYRDSQWHHAVGTLGDDGMKFYVDGILVGQRSDVEWARTGYLGYVRIGGGALNGYPNTNTGTGRWFDGSIDEVALYKQAVTATEVADHFTASGRTRNVPADHYGATTVDLGPSFYWRLGESAGTTAVDASPQGRDGSYEGPVVLGTPGVLDGVADTAATFDGSTTRLAGTGTATPAPQVFTQELWFNTTTTTGGKLIGFGDQSGTADSATSDRHVYMQDDGRLVFGTNTPGTTNADQGDPAHQNRITTADSYNDGAWHQVVATQSAAGLRLYVDGLPTGSHPATSARDYLGYWRVGGDPTWGSTSSRFAGTIDEVAVFPFELTADQVFQRYSLGSGSVPNVPPVASFTATALSDGQTVAVDGSLSTDSDGTIVDWAWDFGDGTPVESTPTPTTSHLYVAAGTFTVTLTVTDDDGDTHQTTGAVSTLGPNTAPLAALTVAIDGLAAGFDGSASADPDGTVVGWAWDFGDGTPIANGAAAAAHTYAVAGPYAVTLTVTDDRGGTHQISRDLWVNDLPVVPPPPVSVLAADTFERALTNSFGTADVGGNWSLSANAVNYSVANGAGRMRMANAGASPAAYLDAVASTNTSLRVDLSFEKAATGGGVYSYLVGRRIGTTGDYRAIVRYQANGTLQATLTRRTGTTDVTLASVNPVPGVPMAAGQAVSARLEVVGTNPTQLALRLWPAGTPEPGTWVLTASDASATHQVAGAVGLATYLSGSATNAPNFANYDNLVVSDPTAPVNATPSARFTTVTNELVVGFDASTTVDDGTIVGWAWDFGDGTQSDVGPTIQHAFAAAGTYNVLLTVTDDQGATNQVSLNVIADAG